MPATPTKSARSQKRRQKADRDAGMAEANITKCLEDPELSSDSRAIGARLLKQAKNFKRHGPKYCRLLKTASHILTKAVESSANLRALQTSQTRQRFKFESGDAFSLSLRTLAATEAQHLNDDLTHHEMVREWQEGKGVTDHKAIIKAYAWKALSGRQTSLVKVDIDREWDLVTSWAQQGSDAKADNAPSTPYLDRLALLCRRENLDRWSVLSWIYSYSDRNENAHHPLPTIENYPNVGGWSGERGPETSHLCVNWQKLKEDTDARVEEIRNLEAAGTWTTEEAKEFISAINYRLKKLVDIGQHGEVEPTEKTKSDCADVHKNVLKQQEPDRTPAPDFPSPYAEGKWDDFKLRAKPFSN